MVATEISNRPAPPAARTGSVDVDLPALAALRDYVLAADRFAEAKKAMEAARAVLDELAGDHQAVTHAGQTAYQLKAYPRRTADLDRLAQRHPDVYADVVTESTTYRLDIDGDYRRMLRLRTWRAALRARQSRG